MFLKFQIMHIDFYKVDFNKAREYFKRVCNELGVEAFVIRWGNNIYELKKAREKNMYYTPYRYKFKEIKDNELDRVTFKSLEYIISSEYYTGYSCTDNEFLFLNETSTWWYTPIDVKLEEVDDEKFKNEIMPEIINKYGTVAVKLSVDGHPRLYISVFKPKVARNGTYYFNTRRDKVAVYLVNSKAFKSIKLDEALLLQPGREPEKFIAKDKHDLVFLEKPDNIRKKSLSSK